MAGRKGQRNLSVEIGVLEAARGLVPSIAKCKNIAQDRSKRGKALPQMDVDSVLDGMRRERLSRKIFSVQKVVQRVVKKAKAFAIQRLVKKLKITLQEDKKVKLEESMKVIKALDHVILSKAVFNLQVICANDYLTGKLESFKQECNVDVQSLKLIEANALDKSKKEIISDLEVFVKKLYHELPKVENTEEDGKKKRKWKKKTKPQGVDGGVDGVTLASGDEPQQEDNDSHAEDMAVTNDEEPRRNRKGQRARRLEWESKYGEEAAHLKRTRDEDHSTRVDVRMSSRPQPVITYYDNEDKLHPSWEAKKREREMIKSAAGQNKRIKFDDDDE